MIRRVVTGHRADGTSVVISDDRAPAVHETAGGDAQFVEIWETPSGDDDPTRHPVVLEPPPGGTRARVVVMRPGSASPLHRTDTVDYGVVLEGELYLVLDDSEVLLRPGDVVVQRGTNHAWDNRSNAPARMLFVLVDATQPADSPR